MVVNIKLISDPILSKIPNSEISLSGAYECARIALMPNPMTRQVWALLSPPNLA